MSHKSIKDKRSVVRFLDLSWKWVGGLRARVTSTEQIVWRYLKLLNSHCYEMNGGSLRIKENTDEYRRDMYMFLFQCFLSLRHYGTVFSAARPVGTTMIRKQNTKKESKILIYPATKTHFLSHHITARTCSGPYKSRAALVDLFICGNIPQKHIG